MIGFYAAGAMGEGEAVPRWNPLDAATQLTLSSNDRVCTRSSTDNNSWRSVRSVTSHHSGKWLAQCRINANGAANGSMIFGVGTSAASLNSYPGAGVTSWGAQANNSPTARTYTNGSSSNTGAAAVGVGGSAIVAVDFDAGLIWFGDSVAGWYGSGNPAAGTNPRYTFTPNTTLYLMLGQYSSPMQNTLLNGPGEATVTVPSGFAMWG